MADDGMTFSVSTRFLHQQRPRHSAVIPARQPEGWNIEFGPIHPATFASVYIETKCRTLAGEFEVVSNATGFIYRPDGVGQHYLITNWHVVTGRDPMRPQELLVKTLGSPQRLSFWVSGAEHPLHFREIEHDLYRDGQPQWLELTPASGPFDLIAIPIIVHGAHLRAVQDVAEIGGKLAIGDDVIVVGFPFGRYEKNPLSIWKKAMIASEPSIMLSGRPRLFLDVPGRPGMSGSPVYVIGKGYSVSSRLYTAINDPGLALSDKADVLMGEDASLWGELRATLRFVGVYSGSVGRGEGPARDMGLGIMWLGPLIEQLVREGVPGTNPFPPDE